MKLPSILLFVQLSLLSTQVHAQHTHGVLTPGVTFPQEDAVLRDPPRMITMSFRVDVTLLKLALYTAEGDWIDIGYRYDPEQISHSFVHPISSILPASDYYVARWSVTDGQRLLNGEFKFSFGPGAIAPSEVIAAKTSDRQEYLPSTGSYRLGTEQ